MASDVGRLLGDDCSGQDESSSHDSDPALLRVGKTNLGRSRSVDAAYLPATPSPVLQDARVPMTLDLSQLPPPPRRVRASSTGLVTPHDAAQFAHSHETVLRDDHHAAGPRRFVRTPRSHDNAPSELRSADAGSSAAGAGAGAGAGAASPCATTPPSPCDEAAVLPPVPKRLARPDDFQLLSVIGQGAFGKVFQVRHKVTQRIFAMKVLKKKHVLAKNQVDCARVERNVMVKVHHPFLVGLKCAFQSKDKLYFVMDYLVGGELFMHLQKNGLLLEEQVRIYAAEMVLAIEHLHRLNVIHRDLKPENVLLDREGHLRLTDYGLAKDEAEDDDDSVKTLCGTNEYMAPEMLARKGYGKAVDWWSLGAVLFEMLTSQPPFKGRNRKKLYERIMHERVKFPNYLSPDCVSFLKGLLERNVERRLGATKSTMFKIGGVRAIKNHRWFKRLDWNKVERREVKPPIVPAVSSMLDTSNFHEEFTSLPATFNDSPVTPGASDAFPPLPGAAPGVPASRAAATGAGGGGGGAAAAAARDAVGAAQGTARSDAQDHASAGAVASAGTPTASTPTGDVFAGFSYVAPDLYTPPSQEELAEEDAVAPANEGASGSAGPGGAGGSGAGAGAGAGAGQQSRPAGQSATATPLGGSSAATPGKKKKKKKRKKKKAASQAQQALVSKAKAKAAANANGPATATEAAAPTPTSATTDPAPAPSPAPAPAPAARAAAAAVKPPAVSSPAGAPKKRSSMTHAQRAMLAAKTRTTVQPRQQVAHAPSAAPSAAAAAPHAPAVPRAKPSTPAQAWPALHASAAPATAPQASPWGGSAPGAWGGRAHRHGTTSSKPRAPAATPSRGGGGGGGGDGLWSGSGWGQQARGPRSMPSHQNAAIAAPSSRVPRTSTTASPTRALAPAPAPAPAVAPAPAPTPAAPSPWKAALARGGGGSSGRGASARSSGAVQRTNQGAGQTRSTTRAAPSSGEALWGRSGWGTRDTPAASHAPTRSSAPAPSSRPSTTSAPMSAWSRSGWGQSRSAAAPAPAPAPAPTPAASGVWSRGQHQGHSRGHQPQAQQPRRVWGQGQGRGQGRGRGRGRGRQARAGGSVGRAASMLNPNASVWGGGGVTRDAAWSSTR